MAKLPQGLPSKQQILDFIASSEGPAGKREMSKAFGLKGHEKIALKALLKDMADEGLIDMAPGRAFHKMGGVPKVTVLKIVAIDGNQPVAIPEHWEAEGIPAPKIRVIETKGKRNSALGIGDRILARTEERGNGWAALPRLNSALQVATGWETAVEHVLSGLLQAPLLPEWQSRRLPPGPMTTMPTWLTSLSPLRMNWPSKIRSRVATRRM